MQNLNSFVLDLNIETELKKVKKKKKSKHFIFFKVWKLNKKPT